MKKILALVLLLALLLNCFAPALAATATYANTKDFVRVLDQKDIHYVLLGVIEEGDLGGESLYIPDISDKFDSDFFYLFLSTGDDVAVRVFSFIEFDKADFEKVLRVANQLNTEYRFAVFTLEESDNTVTVIADTVVSEGHAVGECILELTSRLSNILDDAYDRLSVYAK